MIPARIEIREGPLPRNPNGKIDRKELRAQFEGIFQGIE
jgi:acyl-CoA synthetase (AMP-forming)/AMP-acid ligase II